MSMKTIGLILVAAGGAALYFGYQAYQSAESALSRFWDGTPSQQAMALLGGGAAAVLVGLFVLKQGFKKPKK